MKKLRMDFLFSIPSHIWLAIGVATIVFEFFVAPGMGVVFAGMGALVVGALLEAGLITTELDQLLVFVAATIIWALLLWKPLKNLVANKAAGKGESHIIGTEAVVAKGGVDKLQGSAKWSGTVMNAKLAHESKVEQLKEGQIAEVAGLDGSTLILKPKK
jgi:membrane protein implicated in regulation of membrane protease activity